MMVLVPVVRGELVALARRSFGRHVPRRGYTSSHRSMAAHNFMMPALSPTMTEGNIASWKVKEGDQYTAGDVLLEVETDKASMDVEAQDDGVMAKIIVGDGAKSVQVGTRIAVIGDEGDDVQSLEIPEDEVPAQPAKAKESAPPAPKQANPGKDQQSSKASVNENVSPPGKPQKQRYPLYPSVVAILHERGMPLSDADKIPASGPSGRLLKGDVLAYLGSINASTPAKLSEHLDHLSHLDLSNIKVAERQPQQTPLDTIAEQETAAQPETSQVALTISFKAIREVQQRVHDSLGINVPLETFITRAIEVSNTDLPASKSRKPTADELFDAIVGVKHVSGAETHGHFLPQIIAVAPSRPVPAPRHRPEADIIDILSGVRPKATAPSRLASSVVNESTPSSIFALSVPKGEEERAKIFLERVKTILQVEPGRLVI